MGKIVSLHHGTTVQTKGSGNLRDFWYCPYLAGQCYPLRIVLHEIWFEIEQQIRPARLLFLHVDRIASFTC